MALNRLYVTVSTPGTAVRVSSTDLFVHDATLIATRADGKNVGTVYIGTSDVDHSSDRQMPMAPDAVQTYYTEGKHLNLADFYVDADNSGDGICVLYRT